MTTNRTIPRSCNINISRFVCDILSSLRLIKSYYHLSGSIEDMFRKFTWEKTQTGLHNLCSRMWSLMAKTKTMLHVRADFFYWANGSQWSDGNCTIGKKVNLWCVALLAYRRKNRMSEHALRTKGHVHTYSLAEFLARLSTCLLL